MFRIKEITWVRRVGVFYAKIRGCLRGEHRRRLATWKCWRIQVIAEIEAHRPQGRFVSDANANSLRNIVEITLSGGCVLQTQLRVLLLPPCETMDHLVTRIEHVAGVMEEREAQVVLKERQSWRREPQFEVVDEQSSSPYREARH